MKCLAGQIELFYMWDNICYACKFRKRATRPRIAKYTAPHTHTHTHGLPFSHLIYSIWFIKVLHDTKYYNNFSILSSHTQLSCTKLFFWSVPDINIIMSCEKLWFLWMRLHKYGSHQVSRICEWIQKETEREREVKSEYVYSCARKTILQCVF